MGDQTEILRTRLRERLDQLGKSPRSVSMAIGANQGYVRDLLDPSKTGVPSASRMAALAQQLETTTDWLMGRTDNATQPVSEVSFQEAPMLWGGHKADRIPLVGTGYCADLVLDEDGQTVEIEQLMLEMDHVVRMIERPAALWNAPDAYAIYFHGSSMEPRFYQGEIGIIDPRRPPGPRDFVLVQLNDGESNTVTCVMVKQLERVAGNYVELSQFNPPRTFRIPRDRVARLHRIASPNELLGG